MRKLKFVVDQLEAKHKVESTTRKMQEHDSLQLPELIVRGESWVSCLLFFPRVGISLFAVSIKFHS